MQKNILKVIAAMLALSLVLVACSDKKDDEKTESKKDDTTMTKDSEDKMTKDDSQMDESTMMSNDAKSIAEIAAGNPDVSTALSLAAQAGLGDLLAAEGTLTLFAPTNDAFAKVEPATLAKISANADALSQVLRYHALATEIIATDSLTDGKVITSAEGSTITVNNKDGVITLTTDSGQTVNVVLTGIKASNGIIHLIDTVMIPKDLVLG